MRKRSPRFVRQESWRYKRVSPSWRKPRGGTSRMRRRRSGWPTIVRIGYGTQKSRVAHKGNKMKVRVENTGQLKGLDPQLHEVRIARTVGRRKRREIALRAGELGLKVIKPFRALETPVTEGLEEPAERKGTKEEAAGVISDAAKGDTES